MYSFVPFFFQPRLPMLCLDVVCSVMNIQLQNCIERVINHSFCVLLLMDIWIVSNFLVVMKSFVKNILFPVSWCAYTCISKYYLPRSQIAGSQSTVVFNFRRECRFLSPNICTNLIYNVFNSVGEILLFHILTLACYRQALKILQLIRWMYNDTALQFLHFLILNEVEHLLILAIQIFSLVKY